LLLQPSQDEGFRFAIKFPVNEITAFEPAQSRKFVNGSAKSVIDFGAGRHTDASIWNVHGDFRSAADNTSSTLIVLLNLSRFNWQIPISFSTWQNDEVGPRPADGGD
jgi:hypothetical protein